MTVTMRCDRCGKLVRLPDPRPKATCPHCRNSLVVPPTLASLPYPHVPAEQPPPGEGESPVESVPRRAASTRPEPLAGRLMPWVLSGLFHVGLAVIMMFVVLAASRQEPDRYRPVDVGWHDVAPPAMTPPTDTPPSESDRDEPGGATRRVPDRPTKVVESIGDLQTDKQIILAGGNSGSWEDAADALFGRGGDFFGTPNFGPGRRVPARHVVYVIDRSGSMLVSFDAVRLELIRSVSRLTEKQDFHVILFSSGRPVENPPRRLVAATLDNKLRLVKFLKTIYPERQTDPTAALVRAFEVLRPAKARGGKLIHLLTDAEFPESQKVLRLLKRLNADGGVHINTFLYRRRSPAAEKVMRRIATDHFGWYNYVSPEE